MTVSARTALLIWDFDGTIADTRSAILACATGALGQHDVPMPAEQEIAAGIGLPLAEMFGRLVGDADPELIASLMAAHRADFDATATQLSTAFAGIEDALDEVSAMGVPQAIATSRRHHSLDPLLEHLGLGHHFAVRLTDDDVEVSKPAPDMVLAICEAHGMHPSESLVIGDTSFDMEMGRRAGSATCAVTWGNHTREQVEVAGPDHIADDVSELAVVIRQRLGGPGARSEPVDGS
ncbi:MAG: HAD family hydrolase [Actinomycetia bacterium]|nr:HAD family hydrolase [Actinomycetes bacterium]